METVIYQPLRWGTPKSPRDLPLTSAKQMHTMLFSTESGEAMHSATSAASPWRSKSPHGALTSSSAKGQKLVKTLQGGPYKDYLMMWSSKASQAWGVLRVVRGQSWGQRATDGERAGLRTGFPSAGTRSWWASAGVRKEMSAGCCQNKAIKPLTASVGSFFPELGNGPGAPTVQPDNQGTCPQNPQQKAKTQGVHSAK